MQKQYGLTVQENGVDIVVSAGRLLGRRRHLEGPKEAGNQCLHLVRILDFVLHHLEYNTVAFLHAVSMRTFDVLLDDLLPPPPTQPAPKKTLNLLYFPQLGGILLHPAQGRAAFRVILTRQRSTS